MTDNEIMEAFKLGTALCSDDDVERKDITAIIEILEKAAKDMIPYIVKYKNEEKNCKYCKNYDKDYRRCNNYNNKCYYSIKREDFRRK